LSPKLAENEKLIEQLAADTHTAVNRVGDPLELSKTNPAEAPGAVQALQNLKNLVDASAHGMK